MPSTYAKRAEPLQRSALAPTAREDHSNDLLDSADGGSPTDGSAPTSFHSRQRSSRDSGRTVLVLASRFPPVASVGAIRVRKFVKYLGACGWHPVVLTGAMRQGPVSGGDPRRAADLDSLSDLPPDVPVYRLPAWLDDWPSYLARWMANGVGRIVRVDPTRLRDGLKWRFRRLHNRLSFPDRGIWRFPWAVQKAVELHRRYRFDAIFTTGMPFSDHVIGLAVQSLIRRPWLADFRDPWVEYVHWKQWRSDAGRRLTRLAESAVVRRAATVISVNDAMTQRFRHRYQGLAARRFVTIPNGFDPADFPPPGEPRRDAQFRLLYAGSLYGARSPATVLAAFRQFVARTPGAQSRVRFDFAGRPGPHVDLLSDPADAGRVRYLGMLPHRAVLREMAAADANVVILPNLPGGENDTTAKIYECLGSGRSVLAAVPPEGAAARALAGFEGVWICDPDDVEAQAHAIGELYRRWLAGTPGISRTAESLRPLTRPHQTKLLAACLNAAIESPRHTVRIRP